MTGFPTVADSRFALWAANPFESIEFIVAVACLVGILFGGAIVLYVVDNWRKRQDARAVESSETLNNYRMLYDRGELTDAEYRKIRDRMAAQIKREVAAKNPSAASPTLGLPGTATVPGVGASPSGSSEDPPQPEAGEPQIS